MRNFRQAPKLYHSEKKKANDFYMLPKELMDSVFEQLSGKQGNQIKLITILLGTAGDGSFAVSEKWLCDRAGMDQPSYNRARKALSEAGWLKLEKGSLYIDFGQIRKDSAKMDSSHADGMSSEEQTCVENMGKACDEDMHNKEKQIKNNKKRIKRTDTVAPQREQLGNENRDVPEHVLKCLQELGIDFKGNTVKALEEIVGGELDYYILHDLLRRYKSEFVKAKGKPQGYIFTILKKKVEADYEKERKKKENLRLVHEREVEEIRQQPKMDLDFVAWMASSHKEEEGMDDISELLDDEVVDMWTDEAIPESLKILAQLNLAREEELAEDEF